MTDVHELVKSVNWDCAQVGLKAVQPNGQQHMRYWLPDSIKQELIKESERPENEKTGTALVKYFGGPGTWWVSEYDPEYDLFFGKAEILVKELGYIHREELRSTKIGPFLWVERDFWFEPKPLSEC